MEEPVVDYRAAPAGFAVGVVRMIGRVGIGLSVFGIGSAIAQVIVQGSELFSDHQPLRMLGSATMIVGYALPFLLLYGSIGALRQHERGRRALILYSMIAFYYLAVAVALNLYWNIGAFPQTRLLIMVINGFAEPAAYYAGFAIIVFWILKSASVQEVFR
jgi:hypothetical protein